MGRGRRSRYGCQCRHGTPPSGRRLWGIVMADDAVRIAQFEAELQNLRALYQATREEATAATAERDAALEQQTATAPITQP
jgi:Tfp pilus assembly protein PilN